MSSSLSISDEIIADALATGKTHEEAGALAGCSARTVARRLHDPFFVREVDRRRADLVGRVTGRLSELGHQALDVLAELMLDETPGVRQRAATTILSELPKFTRETDLERRVRQVEDASNASDQIESAASAASVGDGDDAHAEEAVDEQRIVSCADDGTDDGNDGRGDEVQVEL